MTDTAAVPSRISPAKAGPEPKAKRFARSKAPLRTELQQVGSATLLRHFRRSLVRVSVLIAADLTAVFSFGIALMASRDWSILGGRVSQVVGRWLPTSYAGVTSAVAAVVLGLVVAGNYGQGDRRRDLGRLFGGAAFGVALVLWEDLFELGPVVLGAYILLVVPIWISLGIDRYVIDWLVQSLGWHRPHIARTVFVGPIEDCHAAAKGAAFGRKSQYRPVGFVDFVANDTNASVRDLQHALIQRSAEVVVICGYLNPPVFTDVVQAAQDAGCHLLAVSRRFRQTGVEPRLIWEQGQPLIQLTAPMLRGRQLVIKRAMDIVGGALGLLVSAPLFLVVAAAIKLDSRGPVFFRQRRVGRAGTEFDILKFRSMVSDAEARRSELRSSSIYRDDRLFKVVDDPRVTRVGRFLRKTSLDELPQLINVLVGQMSLVGPRPPTPSEVALYEEHHYARLDALPGITGPWQVGGRNRITDFEEVVRLEREYIQTWSIFSDVKILLRTVPVVLKMEGAH